MKNNKPSNEIIIYEGDNGQPCIQVYLVEGTVWLSQQQIAELYQSSRTNIVEHIKHIYEEDELDELATCRNFRHTRTEGNRQIERELPFYNLEMIIALGYRVNSATATKFRQWATARIREYIVKGFAMDDDRLKEMGGGGYWKELLARIRDIRASEKVFYRQILDIYATSIDYDGNADTSVAFFKKVQNKVHYAVHSHTAAEIIYSRADAEKKFMGLTTFQGARPHLTDAVIAKNYLSEKELRALGQIVSGYLDFAERQAEREVPMKMKDWADHLDAILTTTGEKLLLDSGTISHEKALKKAKGEYKKYQAKTLSEVEKVYLDTIKTVQKKVEKKVKSDK
ncbi:MAG: virulence RhuM family protein [Candidatus Omnitrophota bacterium]